MGIRYPEPVSLEAGRTSREKPTKTRNITLRLIIHSSINQGAVSKASTSIYRCSSPSASLILPSAPCKPPWEWYHVSVQGQPPFPPLHPSFRWYASPGSYLGPRA